MMRDLDFIAALVFLCSIEFVHGGSPYLLPGSPPYVTVPENYPVGSELFLFYITDSDVGDTITVTPADQFTATYAKITSTTGNNITVHVTLKKELNREEIARFYLNFTANDRGNQGNEIAISKTVYVTDINDNHPQFQNQPYTMNIPELPCHLTTVYTNISATDADSGNNGTVRYSMQATSQSDTWKKEYMETFSIDNMTGHINLTKCLDYEHNNYYQFNVIAYDLGVPPRTSFIPLIIRVLDVQDTPPFFTSIPYRANVKENINKSSRIIEVYARDGDPGISRDIEYDIINSTCPWCFAISTIQGQGVITANSTLDRDTGIIQELSGICILTVLAKEKLENGVKQSNETEASTDVTITIEDVNDNSPEFLELFYNATVPENTPSNVPLTLLTEIYVKDIDQGRNARIGFTVQYENGSACTDFKVSPTEIQGSGNIIILVNNPDVLDYELIHQINIVVVATEKENPSHTNRTNISIEILDTNDNNPMFNSTSWNLTVPENSQNGTPIGQITATDKDTPEVNKFIHYSISGGNGRFVVNSTTGEIYTYCSNCKAELDREKQDVYYMTYTAKDGDDRSNSVSLVVTLTDENDNIPKFSRDVYQTFIQENDAKYFTSPFVQLEATDNDEVGTINSNIIYSILNTSQSDFFKNVTVNATDGMLFLLSPVDSENLADREGVVNITVQVSDRGHPILSSTAVVMLSIQDMNDNPPIFNQSSYTANVKEDATSNESLYYTVGEVYAKDADVTERNKEFNYFITRGSFDRFTINSSSGIVSVQLNAVLDREQVPRYTLTIIAIDQGSPPLTGTTTMHINVTDVNDEMPKFVEEQFTASIKEDSHTGTNVFNCNAIDRDTDNILVYSITDVQAMDETGKNISNSYVLVKSYFGIHSINGTVYVSGQLDRETAATVILTLLVEDTMAYFPRPQTAKATLTITLLDVNDNPPEFEDEVYNVSVIENARTGYILSTLHATDKDINRTITYGIQYGESPTTSFAIDNKTGLLTKNGSLDRETDSSVILTVIAWDSGVPQKNSSAKVVVTVLDFNDNSPQFENFGRNIIVEENVDNETVVLNVSATDADESPNNVITYSMEGGLGYFVINSTTGSISVSRNLDREKIAEYKLKVIARDNPTDSKEQKSNETIITVNIGDINDNPPIFPNTQFKATITEEDGVGKVVLTVTATDDDDKNTQNANITYEFNAENNITQLFVINPLTGVISVNSSLIDKDDVYLIKVIAYDHGKPQLNDSTTVNITVLDKNRHKPFITNIPSGNVLSVYECANNFSIHNFTFTDQDHGVNAQAHFNITSSGTLDNVWNVFNITPDGNLLLIGNLNVNKKNTYTFEVQATDEGIPPLTSPSVTITVFVIDVNDHDPSFPRKSENWSVHENSTGYINTVHAYDDDKDSLPCYSFNATKSNGSEYFAINNITGNVTIVKALDREAVDTVTLTIDVADCTKSKNVTGCNQNDDTTIQKANAYVNHSIEISITVLDINDNPPVFKNRNLATGMRRVTEPEVVLQIHLRNESYVSDRDTKKYGEESWTFSNFGNITTNLEIDTNNGIKACEDGVKHIFCVTRNGDIKNNMAFSEDKSGYFIVGVKVSDRGGWDTANVTIYLIADTEILTMVVLDTKERVVGDKDAILKSLSSILKEYTAVFDSLQDHKENNLVDTRRSDLSFHLVHNKDQSVVPGPIAVDLIDKIYSNEEMIRLMNMYNVINVNQQSVQEASKENASNRNMYILLAVSVAEAVVISIIIYVFFSNRHKYHRKLKAANIKPTDMELHAVQQNEIAVPGSNMYSKQNNPLLNAQVSAQIAQHDLDDSSSVSFDDVNLDENEVGDPQTVYDRMEEKEVTLDMYGDDVPQKAVSSEDLLAGALQSYEIHKSMESLDNLDEDRPAPAYLNPLFHEDLESTEI